jgi:hypothetical protein
MSTSVQGLREANGNPGIPAISGTVGSNVLTYVPGQHAPIRKVRRHVTRLRLQGRLVPPLRLFVLVQPRICLSQECVHSLQGTDYY